jgi:PEP-CTERM motif
MLRKLAIAAAAVGAVSSAQATVYFLGEHDPTELSLFAGAGAIIGNGISFDDFLVFEVTADTKLTSTVVSLNQAPAIGITGGVYAVMTAGVDGDFTTMGDNVLKSAIFNYNGSTGDTPNLSAVLTPGFYAYGVRGTTVGAGGLYALVSTITPVPEPETVSLMLAGVGLLGFMAKRRKAG